MTPRPDFGNPALWEVHKDLNVFAEHTRQVKDRDGHKRTIRFTRDKLERIAKRNNARDEKGQPCPLMLGHTEDGVPETQQPPIVGYARTFRVAYDKDLKKWVIRAHYYLKKGRADEAKDYPRTSVEVWANDEFFDPIALLKRTPQLDLGQWTYGKGSHRGDVKLRYSMDDAYEDDRDDPKDKPEVSDGPEDRDEGERDEEDTGKGNAGPEGHHDEAPAEFHENFKKCMKKHGYPLKEIMGDSNGPQDGSFPGATDTSVPPQRAPMRDEDEEGRKPYGKARDSKALRSSRNPDPLQERLDRLERYLKNLATQNREVQNENRTLSEERKCERLLRPLEDAGYRFNYEREIRTMVGLNQDERQDHLEYIQSCYDRAPIGDTNLPLDGGPPVMSRYNQPDENGNQQQRVRVTGGSEGRRSQDETPEFTEEHLVKAQAYIHKHPGCSDADAQEYAYGKRTLQGDVVQGRKTNRNGR